MRRLSALLTGPTVRQSVVEFQVSRGVRYMVNSEGTELRIPSELVFMRARAVADAPDGMALRGSVAVHSLDLTRLPEEAELASAISALAGEMSALAKAPVGEAYTGPVLFERDAATQLFAETLGRNLALTRRPLMENNRGYYQASELEGRAGSRILPEWIDVSDDPTQAGIPRPPAARPLRL